jgi:hypothetical protein
LLNFSGRIVQRLHDKTIPNAEPAFTSIELAVIQYMFENQIGYIGDFIFTTCIGPLSKLYDTDYSAVFLLCRTSAA